MPLPLPLPWGEEYLDGGHCCSSWSLFLCAAALPGVSGHRQQLPMLRRRRGSVLNASAVLGASSLRCLCFLEPQVTDTAAAARGTGVLHAAPTAGRVRVEGATTGGGKGA